MLLFAVGAYVIRHVLNESQNGDIHSLCHFERLAHYHFHKLLRRSHDDYAVYRKRLEHRKRYVARSGGHIHEHIVHVAPYYVGPELLYRARDYRAAPYDGIGLVG